MSSSVHPSASGGFEQEAGRAVEVQSLGQADSLGFSQLRIWAFCAAIGVPPALLAAWLGVAPVDALAIAGTALLVGALMVHVGLRFLRRQVVDPATRALEALAQLQRGVGGIRVSEAGTPLMRKLAASINGAISAVDHRRHVSEANLMSVESAFDRIHSVLQSLTEGVILVDDRGRVLLANPFARRVMADRGGRPIEGCELGELLKGELGAGVARGMEQLGRGEHEQIELLGLNAGDRVFDVFICRALSPRDDEEFGTVLGLVDVTSRHELSRLKDEFLSSISHELRTPLTNICAFAEILEQVSPQENEKDWREFLGIVTAESERLRALVDDVLELSRMQNCAAAFDFEPVDVGALAARVVGTFRDRAAMSQLQLDLATHGDDLVCHGDEQRLHQVLVRLLDNALKFTPAGGRVRVDVEAGAGTVDVAVSDSGLGIPPQHREAVFERFRQLGDEATGKPKGTGLGLAICRGIVDGMGGAMWCEDSELGGAKLRFYLPVPAHAVAH